MANANRIPEFVKEIFSRKSTELENAKYEIVSSVFIV
jgi:hypothetical protein